MRLFTLGQFETVLKYLELNAENRIGGPDTQLMHSAEHYASIHHIELIDIEYGSSDIETECKYNLIDERGYKVDANEIDEIIHAVSWVASIEELMNE